MDVLNSLLSFLLIISSVSGVQPNNTICKDDFRNMDGKKINASKIYEMCKGKHCIMKCCQGYNTFLFDNKITAPRCTNKTMQSVLHNKTVNFDFSVKVYEGSSETDVNLVTRNLKDYHFVYNTKLMKIKCSSGIPCEPQDYYPFYVSFHLN